MEMGKTMFEVMKMRKNNKQNPFPLRKYYHQAYAYNKTAC